MLNLDSELPEKSKIIGGVEVNIEDVPYQVIPKSFFDIIFPEMTFYD